MSRPGSLPPASRIRPWYGAGEAAWSLPVVQGHFADPAPALSERALFDAHGCPCHGTREERHTLAEWDEIEARQRAFAADADAVDAESRDILAALERGRKDGAA